MKYIKWILLVILIFFIIITIYMYIDFRKPKGNILVDVDTIDYIYEKRWYKIGLRVYENNELIDEKFGLKNNKYMMFDKENIKYCDDTDNECEEHKYSYNDGIIYMPINFFVMKGNYNVTFNENVMELSMVNGEYMFIYYFEGL